MPRFTQLFASLGLADVGLRLVINRYTPGPSASMEELARLAGTPVFACIPRDDRVMDALQLYAEDLWRQAPSSRLARAFEDLARRLDDPAADVAPPRLVARLMGAIGVRS